MEHPSLTFQPESSDGKSSSEESDSSSSDSDAPEASHRSDDEYEEEWNDFDRNQFIADLLERNNEQREKMSNYQYQMIAETEDS